MHQRIEQSQLAAVANHLQRSSAADAIDHIEQWTRPVWPPANRNWAVMARSTSGPRSFACAETTSGVEPPNLRTISTA